MIIKISKNLNIKILLIFSLLIFMFFFTYIFLKICIEKDLNTDKFYKGTIIDDVNIGGMDKKEAKEMIYKKLKENQKDINIIVHCDDKIEKLHGSDFVYKYNIEKTIKEVYDYAREGNIFNRYIKLLKIKNNKNKFFVETDIDQENLTRIVNILLNKFDDKNLEAHVKEFNPNSNNMFIYENGKDGYKLDRTEVTEQLKNFILKRKSGEVYLQKHEYKNTTTIEDAKNNTQLIGEFKTVSTNSENGNKNMKLSMDAINGTILNPGETFSFNAIVGDSNDPRKGFLPGASILNGNVVMSYGGGICQAATTIYGAAIRADMTIIERRNHCFKSSYVPYGVDATIDYNNIDLKFRNDLFYPIYIKATMQNKELLCQIFGPKSNDFDKIEVNSWNINENENIMTETERIYYKNNKIINKKKLPFSVYKSK